mmetsp:Transcript_72/g.156  ORF Transcript_72/g.156 Transcript_72/m.156 type:complete len:354 (+) Transcript_72:98-1159(+)
MAPKKATKRSDGTTATPAAKRMKADPNLAGVVEALEKAAGLPEGCRKMLLACVPHTFCTPCGERHESQVQVVEMIGEAMQGVETTLKEAADKESDKVADVEASKAGLQAALTEAEATQTTAAEEVKAKKALAAEAAVAANSAKSFLQEAEDTRRVGDTGFLQAQESKAALEACIESQLQAIIDGQGDPEQHYRALLPLLTNLGLDDSLLNALPSTCKKTAADRGSFDTMVLEQLGTCLREQVAKLAKDIEEATPAAQERAAAVEVARAELQKVTDAQTKAGVELDTAEGRRRAAIENVRLASEALATFEPEYTKATQAREEKAALLEKFRLCNMACFTQLRDHASPKVAGGGA